MLTDQECVDYDSEVPFNPRENTSSPINSHDEIESKQGSVTHPYRSLMDESGFPRCHRVTAPPRFTVSYDMQTYTRTMLRQGNGTPLWNPMGYGSEAIVLAKNSLSIGDVGFFNTEGSFQYYFNIFMPATHSAQYKCPPGFEPLSPPLRPTELVTNATYFPPGTTLVSPGVDVSCLSTDPMDMTFAIKAREAGILVMPEGGARMDLTREAANRIRDYSLKHIREWYRFLNPGIIQIMMLCPNASICVITGHDKAPSWAMSTVHPYNQTGKPRSIRYIKDDWRHDIGASYRAYKTPPGFTDHAAVFVRTIRFALGKKDWIEHLLENEPIDIVGFYYLPTVPILGLRALYQTLKERIFKKAPRSVSDQCCETIFHPLVAILQILLAESTSSRTAMIEDSIWDAVASECDGSLSYTTRSFVKLLESHQISRVNEYVTLTPPSTAPVSDDCTPSKLGKLPFSLLDIAVAKLQSKRRRSYIASKLSTLFPGPCVPSVYLAPLPKPRQ